MVVSGSMSQEVSIKSAGWGWGPSCVWGCLTYDSILSRQQQATVLCVIRYCGPWPFDTKYVADGAMELPQVSYAPDDFQEKMVTHSDNSWPLLVSLSEDICLASKPNRGGMMIVDWQLKHAHWPFRKVVKLNISIDGCVRLAEVNFKDQINLCPVARQVHLPTIPNAEDL